MDSYDVIIIGGGPGGSTAGSALAQAGKKVLIIERERFPRFHIGESLIPFANEELRKIGAWDKLQTSNFMPKLGAEFAMGDSSVTTRLLFSQFLPAPYAQTFQVERARFDHVLLDHAAESGCEVWQETRVESVAISDERSSVVCTRGGERLELSARWILDASGRDSVLGKQLNLPKCDLGLSKKFATFAHFHGVRRNDPPADGHITVVRLGSGWFWIIPLDAEKTSVGLVQTLDHFRSTNLKPEECFEKVVASTPELQRRLGSATRVSDYSFAGDFTFRLERNAGPRWMLVGDAAGFIDPIFSSGVMLAIKSGYLAAQQVVKADLAGKPLSAADQRRYTREVGKMCKVFLNMIKMFYSDNGFEVFMSPEPDPRIKSAVNNLVAGRTDLTWGLRVRVWAFYAICALQKFLPLAPRLRLAKADGPAYPRE
jgi:flavin-dependent dehydrogenase